MDFFDPQKQKRHTIRLTVGYVLIGVMLLLATLILLYYSKGFGIDKKGRVIQYGLVFVSSRPRDAEVFVGNKRYKDNTNTRINLPAGQYTIQFKRDGYRDWKRGVTVGGGTVERLDYPLLVPKKLATSTVKQYGALPALTTQSPDRRWLLVAVPNHNEFDVYDLNEEKPVARTLAISEDILAAGSVSKTWELVEWSKDNRHVVLKRSYEQAGQARTEYILFDREAPELSRNLSVLMGFSPTALELRDQAYDQYYVYDEVSAQVLTASLGDPVPKPYLTNVLAFTSEKDVVAYVTTTDAAPGKVSIQLKQNNDPSLEVRQAPIGAPYMLDMGVYEHKFYLAAGAAVENKVFLFRDPIAQLHRAPQQPLAPIQILKIASPDHLSFSATKRFIVAESGTRFVAYDAETDQRYTYDIPLAMDAPQTGARWVDGFRLGYVSTGKAIVFDFDGTNVQQLMDAHSSHPPVVSGNYRYMYTIDGQNGLISTPLLTAKDL